MTIYRKPDFGPREYFLTASALLRPVNPILCIAVNTLSMQTHTRSKFSVPVLFLLAFGIPMLEGIFIQKITDLNYFLNPAKLFPAAAAYGLLLAALRSQIEVSFSRTRLMVHILCVLLFFIGTLGASDIPFWYGEAGQAPWVHYLAVYSVLATLFVTGLFLWINPFLYYRSCRAACLFAFLAGTSRLAYDLLNPVLWKALSQVYIPLLVGTLKSIGFEVSRGTSDLIISHPSLVVKIQPGCSGLDGVFFFIGVFSALMIFDFSKFSRKNLFKIFAAGSGLMLVLNYFRLLAFLIYGYAITGEASSKEGSSAMLQLFHSNVGWLLYSSGIMGWTCWVYQRFGTKPAGKS